MIQSDGSFAAEEKEPYNKTPAADPPAGDSNGVYSGECLRCRRSSAFFPLGVAPFKKGLYAFVGIMGGAEAGKGFVHELKLFKIVHVF